MQNTCGVNTVCGQNTGVFNVSLPLRSKRADSGSLLGAFALSWKAPVSWVMFVRSSPCTVLARLPLGEFPWNLILEAFMKICRDMPNVVKTGGKYRTFYTKTLYILFLPATINRYKIALFEWYGIRLIGEPGRHRRCTNAPPSYIIRALLNS
jgi:hypothetical protein